MSVAGWSEGAAPWKAVLIWLLPAALCAGEAPASPPAPRAALNLLLDLHDDDWEDLAKGRLVTRILPAIDRKEVAAMAVARVRTSPEAFLALHADLGHLRREDVAAFGRFSAPPREEDVAALVPAADDLEDLPRCRPGACRLKLTADAIALATAGPGPVDAASSLRAIVLKTAEEYSARGAMPVYVDRPAPLAAAEAFQGVAGRPPRLAAAWPELQRLLDPGPGEGVLYWSQERFWRRVVLGVSELRLHREPGVAAAVTKAVFEAHYFEASLSAALLVEDAGGPLLVLTNRTRSDHKGGGFSGLERLILHRLARKRIEKQLRSLKERLEGQPEGPPARQQRSSPASARPAGR